MPAAFGARNMQRGAAREWLAPAETNPLWCTEHARNGQVTAWAAFRSCCRPSRKRQARVHPPWRSAPAVAMCRHRCRPWKWTRWRRSRIRHPRSIPCPSNDCSRLFPGRTVICDRKVWLTSRGLPPTARERCRSRAGAPRECCYQNASNQRPVPRCPRSAARTRHILDTPQSSHTRPPTGCRRPGQGR